jgi:hypothetical protein
VIFPLNSASEPLFRGLNGASRSSGLVTARIRRIGDAGVKRRRVELGMTQKRLNHANIDILLKEVRGDKDT